jgi:hypothetical protein
VQELTYAQRPVQELPYAQRPVQELPYAQRPVQELTCTCVPVTLHPLQRVYREGKERVRAFLPAKFVIDRLPQREVAASGPQLSARRVLGRAAGRGWPGRVTHHQLNP